uniref:Fibronectin type-III domain-containing protein n=1 Tax=Globisporangium ultimum (strain ATCC 200006 / CBS 805.95 / DAOM BR144) TaxID=431595 RepID=K3WPH1_GLOUD
MDLLRFCDAVKKAASFVMPTLGSPHSLTLSTYVTNAADLHYAVVRAGHAPLDASAIKNAAAQCVARGASSSSLSTLQRNQIDMAPAHQSRGAGRRSLNDPSSSEMNDQTRRISDSVIVAASTVIATKAQKIERHVDRLDANTSYDVYFVAEVPGSNGVFGTVQAVLHSTTRPEPPVIAFTSIQPANESATSVHVQAMLSTPGRVYFALVPSTQQQSTQWTPHDLVHNQSVSEGPLPSTFALFEQLAGSDSLVFEKVVDGLVSATLYDLMVVTEAVGDGEVYSDVVRLGSAVRTHFLPLVVTQLAVAPQDARADALALEFHVRVQEQDLARASVGTLRFFAFNMHYEATRLLPNGEERVASPSSARRSRDTRSSPQTNAPATTAHQRRTAAAATTAQGDSSQEQDDDTVVRGVFSFGNFSSMDEFQEQLAMPQRYMVTGLHNGTLYVVTLFAETATSNGLVGSNISTSPRQTHETAPRILAARGITVNGSVHALAMDVEMERGANVHYLVVERSALPHAHRQYLQEVKNVDHFMALVRSGGREDAEIITGVVSYDPSALASSESQHGQSNATKYTASFHIDGLRDATMYAIAFLPETFGSNGVFGQPFEQWIELQTNENASEVHCVAAEPVLGSVSAIELAIEMTKPHNVLYYCLMASDSASAVNSKQEPDANNGQESWPMKDCQEANRSTFTPLNHRSTHSPSSQGFVFVVGNLTEDTMYRVHLFAENANRNQVFSVMTNPPQFVKTHERAPEIVNIDAVPVAAFTDRIATSLAVKKSCLVHYAVHEAPREDSPAVVPPSRKGENKDGNAANAEQALVISPEAIIKEKWLALPSTHARIPFVSQGSVVAASDPSSQGDARATFEVATLKANTTYVIHVVMETATTSNDDSVSNASGVYGIVTSTNVTTFAAAPKIVKATVDPTPDRTDAVFIVANLSTPGIVHYLLSDVDFADPAIIRRQDTEDAVVDVPPPHTVRGTFEVASFDIAMERLNGSNESTPMEPLMFSSNVTVQGLRSGATYHVSLTTETFASGGVFGDFPPPILVMTHLLAPRILDSVLSVKPKPGKSDTLALELELNRFGNVHYALFFRGLVPDRSDAIFAERRRQTDEENARKQDADHVLSDDNSNNATNISTPVHVWPPITSSYDLTHLNASSLKTAAFEDLGEGVWDNGTITITREDVLKGKLTVKEIKKLPPNALFDACLVSETTDSDGVFDWTSAEDACHRVKTHADYSNQSILLDEISVVPMDGHTGSIRIKLAISKVLDSPATTDTSLSSATRFALAADRTPYYILADGKEARREFSSNSFSTSGRNRDRSGFKDAVPGTHGVVSAGVLPNITHENATFLVVTQEIHGLKPNHQYFLFFAYETSGSDGVLTKVNPHRNRTSSAESSDSNAKKPTWRSAGKDEGEEAIEVVTYEAAPSLIKYAAKPTFGNASWVTVTFDIVCTSCSNAIVHALVYPEGCPLPKSPVDTLSLGKPSSAADQGDVDNEGSLMAKQSSTVLPKDESDSHGVATMRGCTGKSLLQRRFVVEMENVRDGKLSNVKRELFAMPGEEGQTMLTPNTTYSVLLATETAGSNGVLSDMFTEMKVTTFALAPTFEHIQVTPRNGSTTELVLAFKLSYPGEVHYLCGVSGNPELNVTSAYNVSHKRRPERDAPNFHNYARDVVRLHRSISIDRAGEKHVELLEYLTAGTTYDVYVVAESANSNGVYGDVFAYKQVSTHANPPILLAHAASPTPGATTNLTVGFRVDNPGTLHFSVVQVEYWAPTKHVAFGSGMYGNRLAVHERLVAQERMVIDDTSMHVEVGGGRDSGWREINISVPQAGANYTAYLVTETTGSDGVFGTVASHRDVRSHRDPPSVLQIAVTPADARVDALTAHVHLSDEGHVHFVVLPHRRSLSEWKPNENDDNGIAVAKGMVIATSPKDAKDPKDGRRKTEAKRSISSPSEHSSSAGAASTTEGPIADVFCADFVIDGLNEGTVYDLYFRCETLHSFGVFGTWTQFPISARTHGLPAEVLEEVECAVYPTCEELGRETCARIANVCGECLDGFTGHSGSSNEPCVRTAAVTDDHYEQQQSQKKKITQIKISGVRINPFASINDVNDVTSRDQGLPTEQEPFVLQEQHVDTEPKGHSDPASDRYEDQMQHHDESNMNQTGIEDSLPQIIGNTGSERGLHEFEEENVLRNQEQQQKTQDAMDERVGVEQSMLGNSPLEPVLDSIQESLPQQEVVMACPAHAHMVTPSGECECLPGYTVDALGERCVLIDSGDDSEMSTVEMMSPLERMAPSSRHTESMSA